MALGCTVCSRLIATLKMARDVQSSPHIPCSAVMAMGCDAGEQRSVKLTPVQITVVEKSLNEAVLRGDIVFLLNGVDFCFREQATWTRKRQRERLSSRRNHVEG